MSSLEKAVLATVVYHDAFTLPATAFEVWEYLVRRPKNFSRKVSLEDVIETLDRLAKNYLEEKNGMYMLRGRRGRYESRIQRHKISDRKWKRMRRISWWLQAVPFVRAVFASGSLAFNNTHESSDLDVLVVAEHGRIYTGRTFVSFITEILRSRRRRFGVIARDKICLNHYISTKGLSIPHFSIYNAGTYARLVPLLEQGISWSDFLSANKKWLSRYLVRIRQEPLTSEVKAVHKSRILGGIRIFCEWMLCGSAGDRLEHFFSRIQRRRIFSDPWTYRKGGRVSIDETQLEFHPDSPERTILARYNQTLRDIGFPELAREKDSGLR